MLKVCFIGVGSIAKRHIANLKDVCSSRGIDVEIDAFRRDNEPVEGVDHIYIDINRVPSDYDCIFITNPTSCHLKSLEEFHNKGKSFFIEKPIVSLEQIEDAEQFKLKSDVVYYVACPIRYCSVIRYIRENINVDDVISVRSISSSYLPDWRPGTDYRKTYSAHKNMGGGVSIDLIHEWDYLTYLFGWPEEIKMMKGKKSSLDIDSDDYAIYLAEYTDKIVEVHLDYFGRNTIRKIELITKNDTIIGDIVKGEISFLKTGKTVNLFEQRDDFQRLEISHFLDIISGMVEPDDGFNHGIRVLKLTQGNV